MLSLGLDISSTSTGVVLLDSAHAEPVFQGLFKPEADGLPYHVRGDQQANKLLALLEKHQPDRILIEGYSLGSATGAEPLITVGAILRYVLHLSGYAWGDVAPSRLKKFAGAALKQDMKLAVFKRWGFEHSSDDVIDAYVLALIAEAMGGHHRQPLIKPQQEVVTAMSAPPAKKKRKTKKAA